MNFFPNPLLSQELARLELPPSEEPILVVVGGFVVESDDLDTVEFVIVSPLVMETPSWLLNEPFDPRRN